MKKKTDKQKSKEIQIKDLSERLGKETLQMNGSTLVDVLNKKYGEKDNKTPFQYGDIQQYYIREALPDKYGGLKLELKEGPIGKYLIVHVEGYVEKDKVDE